MCYIVITIYYGNIYHDNIKCLIPYYSSLAKLWPSHAESRKIYLFLLKNISVF